MANKKMIVLDIDGILPEVLYETLDDGKSALSAVAGRGLRVERGVTVLPSVTLCCQASMFTGVFPNRHRVVGNSWFDRRREPPFFRNYTTAASAVGNYGFALFGLPTVILPQRPKMQHANNDMSAETATVYEMAKRAGMSTGQAYNQYSRGVDRWIKPSRPQMILFAICHEEKLDNRYWDASNFKRVNRDLRKRGVPDIYTLYISGHDNNSHENGPGDQKRYFRNVVDPMFAGFLKTLEAKRDGAEYYFLITADHGQAATRKEKDFVVPLKLLGEILGAVDGGGFQFADGKKVRTTDTAVGCQEAGMVQFHLMNRKTFAWTDAPRFEEDVLAAARAFEAYRRGTPPFVDQILVRRTVEEGYLAYESGQLIPIEKYYEGREEDYPDAVRRIRGVNCDMSGDMIVLLRYQHGYYFGDKVKAGEHGSLHEADSLIPIVLSGPGIPNGKVERASLVDVVPTVGKVMGFETPGTDGKAIF